MDTNETIKPETQPEPSQARCAVPICSASENCPECGTRFKWNGTLSHSPTCSQIDLETARWYAASADARIQKHLTHLHSAWDAAQRWEGKFRVVCHENNQLRRKLSSQNDKAQPRAH